MMCCMSVTRTQVYLTAEQRAGLDERARVERKTMAHVIRDAVDTYLAADVDGAERERLLADTFGSCPGLGERVPSRDEWDREIG
ncbi:hypothetical protein DQ238_22395 [Geodermatophilus sp. TF02-6]|nr:hypothetical protein DQ238_22395 [Geodermatophilus sp. TF02-6]